jgi:hypothetical protein
VRFRAVTPYDRDWIVEQLGITWTDDTGGVIADDGHGTTPLGVGVTQLWTENAVTGHMAATTPRVWRRGLHREYFDYIFNACNRTWLFGQVEEGKGNALSIDKKFGFREVARIPDGFRDGCDMILLVMHRDECRFLDRPSKLRAVG